MVETINADFARELTYGLKSKENQVIFRDINNGILDSSYEKAEDHYNYYGGMPRCIKEELESRGFKVSVLLEDVDGERYYKISW